MIRLGPLDIVPFAISHNIIMGITPSGEGYKDHLKIPSPPSSNFPGQPLPGSHLNQDKRSELLGVLSNAKANSASGYQEWRRALESQQEHPWPHCVEAVMETINNVLENEGRGTLLRYLE